MGTDILHDDGKYAHTASGACGVCGVFHGSRRKHLTTQPSACWNSRSASKTSVEANFFAQQKLQTRILRKAPLFKRVGPFLFCRYFFRLLLNSHDKQPLEGQHRFAVCAVGISLRHFLGVRLQERGALFVVQVVQQRAQHGALGPLNHRVLSL